MNKLLVISVLLLIGCSPASPDESEITIGRPEKATSYPIPIGKWKSDVNSIEFDFTDIEYEGALVDEKIPMHPERLPNTTTKMLFIYCKPTVPYKSYVRKGYWYVDKKNRFIAVVKITRRGEKIPYWDYIALTQDRGNLLDALNDGSRWYRQEGK